MAELADDTSPILSLLSCLRREGEPARLDGLGPAERQELLWQARLQGLAPLLYQRLAREKTAALLPADAAQFLREAYYESLGRNLVLFNELQKVLVEFESRGVPILLLKGSYLAAFIYQNIALRPMSDLDVMVRQQDLPLALEIFKGLGYSGGDLPLTAEYVQEYRHAPILVKVGLVPLELHWTLVDAEDGLSIDQQSLWKRAVPVQLDGVRAWALGVEDLVLHVCAHAAYDHTFLLQGRSLVDLAEILFREGASLDWKALKQEAINWQVERGLFLMLDLARRIMGASVPGEVLNDLRPPDFDPSITLEMIHLFGVTEASISSRLGRVVHNSSLGDKVLALREVVFPPRVEVGRIYGISERSWRIIWYYPVLWLAKVGRQWKMALNLLTRKNETGRNLKALYEIQAWLKIPGAKEHV